MTYKGFINSYEDLKGKLIIVTGGTSGIGYQLVRHLLNKHADVLLLSRNLESTNKVIEILKKDFPNSHVEAIKYDQSSFASIKEASDIIIDKYNNFYALVANAGVLVGPKGGRTREGYPTTIGVNYIGTRYLIDYLSSKLDKPHKFVIQGSIVAAFKLKKNADLKKQYNVFTQYNISKIYTESYAYSLMNSNSIHEYILTEPGISNTRIIRHFNGVIRVLGKYFLALVFHSPKKASLTLFDGIRSTNGEYIVPRGLFTMSGLPKHKKLPHRRIRKEIVNQSI